MIKQFLAATALSGLLMTVVPAAWAQDQAAAEDPVLATVNGEPVTQSQVMQAVSTLPPQYQANLAALLPTLLNRIIDMRLVGVAGREAGLAEDAEVKKRMDQVETEVIRQVYMEREIEARVTDEKVRARYEKFKEETPPEEQIHARHILLKTEEDATAVIAELDAGGDFVKLAEERSTGPSATNGGDLGFFVAGQMVPEFSEAAFALEPGSYSKEPVQTSFGFHVILTEERRTTEPPAFEDIEPKLREEVTGAELEALLAEVREGAAIEINNEALAAVTGAQAPEAAPSSE